MTVSPLPPLLPPVTAPPPARSRMHSPARQPYENFRACLRQEFEFTCALCLLHESDLAPLGIEGTGLFSVEHVEPQSARPDLVTAYRNCLYACRFCNTRRGDQPVKGADGVRLLDPTSDAWSDLFEPCDDRLEPRVGSGLANARYTAAVYKLNDPVRVRLRQERRTAILDALQQLRDLAVVQRRIRLAEEELVRGGNLSGAEELRSVEGPLRAFRDQVLTVLRRFAIVPERPPTSCRCRSSPLLGADLLRGQAITPLAAK